MRRELEVLAALVQHDAPRRRGRLRGKPEEREGALREHRPGEGEAHLDDEGRKKVRDDVAHDDTQRGRADRARGLYEIPHLEREDRAADHAGEDGRVDDADGDHDVRRIGAKGRDDAEREEDRREGKEDVQHAPDGEVEQAADVARDKAEPAADERGPGDGEDRDLDRQPRPPQHAAQEVAPQGVGPEREFQAGRGKPLRRHLKGIAEREEAHGERDENVERDHPEPEERQWLARERRHQPRPPRRADARDARRGGSGDPGSHRAGRRRC